MKHSYIPDIVGGINFSCIILTALVLHFFPQQLGFIIIFWSILMAAKYFRMMDVSKESSYFDRKNRPVAALLKGVAKKYTAKDKNILSIGIAGPLLILICVSVCASTFVILNEGEGSIVFSGIVTLLMMIFWYMQSESINPYKAGILGIGLTSVLCFQILFFHHFNLDQIMVINSTIETKALAVIGSVLTGFFIRGLFIRHKYQIFPAIGLFLVLFITVFGTQLEIMTFPVLASLLAICFAQSFPSAKGKYFQHSPYNEILT